MGVWGGIVNVRQTPMAGAGTTAQRPAITVPGFLWSNLDDPDNPYWERYNGTAWVDYNASAPTLPAWALAGNALAGGERFGSTNNVDVLFYRNNVEMMHFLASLIEVHQNMTLDADKKITIGAMQLFDDSASGPRLLQTLGAQNLRIRSNTTNGAYLALTPAAETTLKGNTAVWIITRNNSNAKIVMDSDSVTRRVVVTIGTTEGGALAKYAVLKSEDLNTAAYRAPDLYIYAGANSVDVTQADVFLCHNGTAAAGRLGVGNNAATSRVDITGATGYTQFRLRTTYTPTGTADANGAVGDTAWDDDYFYLKTSVGWKRTALTVF